MAPTERPATPASADQQPSKVRRRRIVDLGAAMLVSALLITGCTWLTTTGTTPVQRGQAADTTAASSSTAAAGITVSTEATTATETADTPDAEPAATTATSAEVLEVSSRLTEASIDPGACGTVTYTPNSASTAQVGDLCIPEHQAHSTVIVLVHGGGGKGGGRADLAAWQRRYAELGYVTFSIDYRLTDTETDDGVWPEPEQDVKAAIQFIRLAGSALGTDKVIVQGHSAGARLAGVILTTPDDATFQGDQLWTEPSDAADGFIGFYGYYNGFQFEWDAYYGKGNAAPAEADASSNAGQASGPALLIAGTADSMVVPSESTNFADALTAAGKDATLVQLDGRNHGFDQQDGQLTSDGQDMMDRIQLWIAQHVEGAGSAG